jgi:hypothetical protein
MHNTIIGRCKRIAISELIFVELCPNLLKYFDKTISSMLTKVSCFHLSDSLNVMYSNYTVLASVQNC